MDSFREKLVLSMIAIAFIGFISTQEAVQNDNQANLQPYNNFNEDAPRSRAKRMYALCPPKFQRVGNECYFFSDYKESWLDSHFECKDRNSKLAEPLRYADKRLRRFMERNDKTKGEDKWIGGMYNWERNQWQWGYNGREMDYQSFSDLDPRSSTADLKFNCAVLSPYLKYRWSAKVCMEKHYFICQHRMPYVNQKRRDKVYAKWNETYPNQMANEVEVYVSTNGKRITRKEYYRTVPIPPTNRINTQRVEIDQEPQPSVHKLRLENEVNPLYTGFNNQEEQQRPKKFEKNEDINTRAKRPLSFGGNVDLFGNKRNPNQKLRHRKRLTTTTTVAPIIYQNELPNEIPQISFEMPEMPLIRKEQVERVPDEIQNTGRHHHHHKHQHEHLTTTTLAPSTSSSTTTTQAPAIITQSPAQIEAHKAAEIKKAKQKLLKERLSKLSPEEVERFIEMKRKLALVKKQEKLKSNSIP